MPKPIKRKFLIKWSGTSYVMLSGFLLLLFLIGYVWWPLLDEYLNQFNPELSVWRQIDWWFCFGLFPEALGDDSPMLGVSHRRLATDDHRHLPRYGISCNLACLPGLPNLTQAFRFYPGKAFDTHKMK